MAFNPFTAFRKHQKVIFAILTIICMFVFILQFGSGDFFSRVSGWFGGNRQKGEKVITLYGRDYYQSDLTKLRSLRQGADAVARYAAFNGTKTAMENLSKQLEASESHDFANPLQGAVLHWKLSHDPKFNFPPSPESIQGDLKAIAREREAELKKDPKDRKKDYLNQLDQAETALRFGYWDAMSKQLAQFGVSSHYFGDTLNNSLSTEGLLDFEVWKRQADKLGITLTPADVRKMLQHDAAGQDLLPKGSWKNDERFSGLFTKENNFTEEELLAALGDEYRVALAQEALLGRAGGVRAVTPTGFAGADPATPYDFWKYFKEHRTETNFLVAPVDVQSFVAQVKRTPPEREIEREYEAHKNDEPKPDRADPAFAEPRRIQVEYVAAKADAPYYLEKAGNNVIARQVAARLAAFGAGAGAGVDGAAAGWGAVAAAGAVDAPVYERYQAFVGAPSRWAGRWQAPSADLQPQPRQVAQLVGDLLGASLTGPSPLSAAAAQQAGDAAALQARVVNAFTGMAGAGDPLSALAFVPAVPQPPPLEAVAQEMQEDLRKKEVSAVVVHRLDEFAAELAKLKDKPEEARKFIDDAVKDKGLELHSMDQVKDKYGLEDDPALKELKQQARGYALDRLLTSGGEVYSPTRFSEPTGPIGPTVSEKDFEYKQWENPASDAERFVFWRVKDVPRRKLSFAEARPRVLEALKQLEARKLAHKAADAAADEVSRRLAAAGVAEKSQGYVDEARKLLAEEHLGEVFELNGVARLKQPPSPDPGKNYTFAPYQAPETIPMPPPDLVDRLLDTKVGRAIVFKDLPAKRFYVALPVRRSEPTQKDFESIFEDAAAEGKNDMWQKFFLPDFHKDFHDRLMRQLREEASPGNVDEKGKLKFTSHDAKEEPQ
jgi:hypothetical protein